MTIMAGDLAFVRFHDSAPMVSPTVGSFSSAAASNADAWGRFDAQLNGWMNDPSAVVDYNAVPPSRRLIRSARSLIPQLRDGGWPPPEMVVPDGNGGISFEFHSGDVYRSLDLAANGEVSLSIFRGGRFERRRPLTPKSL